MDNTRRPRAELDTGYVVVAWPDTGEAERLEWQAAERLRDEVARYLSAYAAGARRAPAWRDDGSVGDPIIPEVDVNLVRGPGSYRAPHPYADLLSFELELRTAILGARQATKARPLAPTLTGVVDARHPYPED